MYSVDCYPHPQLQFILSAECTTWMVLGLHAAKALRHYGANVLRCKLIMFVEN